MEPADIVAEVTTSGLRGRGGAGFPTGIKWKTVLEAKADQKYICCNADEGDSGTFADRMLMEGDPFCLIEGMIIAGIAVGATKGYIYIRSEYPHAVETFREAIKILTEANWLGRTIQGSPHDFELFVRVGAGAYICGEETSMLDSLEGKRGIVRYKPPLPAIEGLFGKPTVINNVLSLGSVPIIIDKGGAYYRDFGVGRSRGTLAFQLAGNIKQGGLVEKAFGVTARELIEGYGGGTASGRPIRAVQFGGPLGAYLAELEARHRNGLRGVRQSGRHGRPRRRGRVRRHCRHGQAGALCHGVLHHRVVRQVHALPYRLRARRRGDRPHRRGREPRGQYRAVAGSLRDDDRWIAVRHGRVNPHARDERAAPFPRGLPPSGACRGGRMNANNEATP